MRPSGIKASEVAPNRNKLLPRRCTADSYSHFDIIYVDEA